MDGPGEFDGVEGVRLGLSVPWPMVGTPGLRGSWLRVWVVGSVKAEVGCGEVSDEGSRQWERVQWGSMQWCNGGSSGEVSNEGGIQWGGMQ